MTFIHISLAVWSFLQLSMALIFARSLTPIVQEPFLYQALAVLLWMVLQKFFPKKILLNILAYAAIYIPVVFLIPYRQSLAYFMWYDYLVMTCMLVSSIWMQIVKNRMAITTK